MSAFTSEQASRARLFAKEEQQRSVRENVVRSATFLSEAKFAGTSDVCQQECNKIFVKCHIMFLLLVYIVLITREDKQ